MVVRLDLVCDSQSVTDIDDSGIFARALQNGWTFGRQTAQMDARALVAAMLAPHDAENAEFCETGFAFEDADDLFIFGFRQSMLREQFVCDHYVRTNAFTMDSKISFPSELPRIESNDRSGCGIMPRTFPEA